jgi:hypothetical protein
MGVREQRGSSGSVSGIDSVGGLTRGHGLASRRRSLVGTDAENLAPVGEGGGTGGAGGASGAGGARRGPDGDNTQQQQR